MRWKTVATEAIAENKKDSAGRRESCSRGRTQVLEGAAAQLKSRPGTPAKNPPTEPRETAAKSVAEEYASTGGLPQNPSPRRPRARESFRFGYGVPNAGTFRLIL